MPQSSISPRDPTTGKPLTIVTESSLLWSSGIHTWDGLVLERHAFDSLETPEFLLPDHSLSLKLYRRPRSSTRSAAAFVVGSTRQET